MADKIELIWAETFLLENGGARRVAEFVIGGRRYRAEKIHGNNDTLTIEDDKGREDFLAFGESVAGCGGRIYFWSQETWTEFSKIIESPNLPTAVAVYLTPRKTAGNPT